MKKVKFLFAVCAAGFFIAALFVACSSASGGGAGTANASAAAGETAASSSSGASWSASIDGVAYSTNKGSDNLNAAFRMKEGEKHLFFMLCDVDDPVRKFNFEVPAAVGTTTVRILPKYSYQGYVAKDFAPYDDDGVTITISSISATRVSGTFSGTYKAEAGWPKAKPSIQVTDGKFDIPFSTSASWKKMYQAE